MSSYRAKSESASNCPLTVDSQTECYGNVAFEEALDAMLIIDECGQHLAVNSEACLLFNLPKEHLIGRYFQEFLVASDRWIWANWLKGQAKTGQLHLSISPDKTLIVRYKLTQNIAPDRHLLIVRDMTEPAQLESPIKQHRANQQPWPSCWIGRDSDRILVEQAIRQHERKDRALVAVLPDTLLRLHRNGTYLEAIPTGTLTSLFAPDRIIGKAIAQVLPPSVAQATQKALQQALTGKPQILEFQLTCEGKKHDYEARLIAIHEDQALVIIRDISDRILAQTQLRRSKQEFQALAENSPDVIARFDRQYCHIYVNPAIEKLTGLPSSSYLGRSHADLDCSTTVVNFWTQAIQQVFDTAQPQRIECELPTLYGLRSMQSLLVPEYAEDGSVEFVLSVTRDLTELKQIEQELRESQEKYRVLFQVFPIGISILDASGHLVEANSYFEQRVGVPPVARYFGTDLKVIRPDGSLLPLEELPCVRGLREKRSLEDIEVGIVREGDRPIWISATVAPIPLKGYGVAIAYVDVTGRKQTEQALRESQYFTQQLTDATPALLYVYDLEQQKNVYANREFTAILGYTLEELKEFGNTLFLKLMHPDDFAQLPARVENFDTLRDGEIIETEYRLRHKNGEWRWLCSRDTVFQRKPDGTPKQILGAAQDITDRKRAEQQCSESEAKFRSLAESATAGIAIIRGKRILYVNPAAEAIAGYSQSELLNCNYWHLFSLESQQFVRSSIRKSCLPSQLEIKIIRKTGEERWLECTRATIEFQGQPAALTTAFDITERKHAEFALRQQTERERLVSAIAQRIRASLNLTEILDTTVAEVRQFLQVDRVIIDRYNSNGDGLVMVESVSSEWPTMRGQQFSSQEILQTQPLEPTSVVAVTNIDATHPSPYAMKLLEEFHVKAFLVVPLMQHQGWEIEKVDLQPVAKLANPQEYSENLKQKHKFWGSLVLQHCQSPRSWQTYEIALLQQLAMQVAIAIQQAELYQQLKQANQQLEKLATLDGLTGLANRRRFDEYLIQQWRYLAREQKPLSLILCDIDFFKLYNDYFGHLGGDFCLQHVAKVLANMVQRPANLVTRYGGEEFAVILPHTTGIGAFQVAEAIREAVKNLQMSHPGSTVCPYVTFSLGVASTIPCLDVLPDMLIATADTALYDAKAQGRDRTVLQQI